MLSSAVEAITGFVVHMYHCFYVLLIMLETEGPIIHVLCTM